MSKPIKINPCMGDITGQVLSSSLSWPHHNRGAADSEKAFRNLTQKPQAGGFIFF